MEQVLGKSTELMYSSLPAMQKTWAQSLGWEDPLEKEMATPVFSLENPRDGGAWWAAVYGVSQSRTQLKRLSSSSSSMLIEINQRKTDTE